MMAQPMKTLELQYPMIQFLINYNYLYLYSAIQGRVVGKPVNVNPGLNVNGSIFFLFENVFHF